ncbi:MAG: short-chain dehydrogenase, partial [Bacteroidales bacterium]|nr:short-chain dehydrogenase [Candidatus Equibacterium intestinale]
KYARMDPGQEGGLTADKAARRIVRAIGRGRREVLVGRFELLMVWIKRFFPGLCAAAARRVNPV